MELLLTSVRSQYVDSHQNQPYEAKVKVLTQRKKSAVAFQLGP